MMEIKFVKMNPTENTTVLVESIVPRERHAEVASALMSDISVCAEQTGFIERPASDCAWARLQMMGGEFCANATMSLAAFLVWRNFSGELGKMSQWNDGSKRSGQKILVPLEVSGAEDVIECAIEPFLGSFLGSIRVPLPEGVDETRLPLAGSSVNLKTVRLPGITHVIVPLENFGPSGVDPRESALRAVGEWAPLIDAEAFGVILYDSEACSITPLVHVKGSGTTVWERGCGSGSAAVGAYIAVESAKSAVTRVSQPGGVIDVAARYEGGRLTDLSITGKVSVAVRGTAYI
jgi:diaminopimelate epimerase